MLALDVCYKDGTVKPNFVEGRLRKYASMAFAYNAGSQMLNNSKNPNIKELYIWDDDTKMYRAIVRRPGKNSDIKTKNELVNIDTYKVSRHDHSLHPLNLSKLLENKKIKDEDNKNKTKEIMTVLKKVHPTENEESKNKENRVEILKEINEKRIKDKDTKPREVELCRDSINNLSSDQLQESIVKNTKEDTSFLQALYACSLEHALKNNDARLLFNTEMALSKHKLSWYVNDKGFIQVDLTDVVLELLPKQK